ncbi:TPA: phage holin family protein, partial [Escherichia coli]|nr:phage holin family protein [Escherichia coli]HCO8314891.1 phage holin family protein [Escherichia coli]
FNLLFCVLVIRVRGNVARIFPLLR